MEIPTVSTVREALCNPKTSSKMVSEGKSLKVDTPKNPEGMIETAENASIKCKVKIKKYFNEY